METRRQFFTDLLSATDDIVRLGAPPSNLPANASFEAHVCNRLMFGPRPGDITAVANQGYDSWLEEQFQPSRMADPECDAALALLNLDTVNYTNTQCYDIRNNGSTPGPASDTPLKQTRSATWVRQIQSKRQLFERTVDFWHNHFNIRGGDYIVRSYWASWDRLIRANAFGNFFEFLQQTAMHPAMLYYLDNYLNSAGGPNENYARESFELHSLGAMNYRVPGGYVDNDVYEASRCLTGWTYETSSTASNRGEFKYQHDRHDRFQKIVMGVQYPNDQAPMVDGISLIAQIARHPGTARHIATKLCHRFVSDTPSAALVEGAAEVFLTNTYRKDQIALVLRYILQSDEFRSARFVKFKRPQDWLISAIRAGHIKYTPQSANYDIGWEFDSLGQPLFNWGPPDGPPDTREAWATTNGFLRRFNIALLAAARSDDGTTNYFQINASNIMPASLRTPRQIVDFWTYYTHQRDVSPSTKNALMEFVAMGRNVDLPLSLDAIEDKIPHLVGLCLCTPEFQWR